MPLAVRLFQPSNIHTSRATLPQRKMQPVSTTTSKKLVFRTQVIPIPLCLMQRQGEAVPSPRHNLILGYFWPSGGKMPTKIAEEKCASCNHFFICWYFFYTKIQSFISVAVCTKRDTDENPSRFASLDAIIYHSKGELQTVVLILKH